MLHFPNPQISQNQIDFVFSKNLNKTKETFLYESIEKFSSFPCLEMRFIISISDTFFGNPKNLTTTEIVKNEAFLTF
jgi:hypothetical protein